MSFCGEAAIVEFKNRCHFERSEKSLESADSRVKSFFASLRMTTYGFSLY